MPDQTVTDELLAALRAEHLNWIADEIDETVAAGRFESRNASSEPSAIRIEARAQLALSVIRAYTTGLSNLISESGAELDSAFGESVRVVLAMQEGEAEATSLSAALREVIPRLDDLLTEFEKAAGIAPGSG